MKNHKRILSIAVAAVMVLGLLPVGLSAFMPSPAPAMASVAAPATLGMPGFVPPATLAAGGEIAQMPPMVTFTVPETLWLSQGVSGDTGPVGNTITSPRPAVQEPQTEIVAYSNITNTAGTQATGEVVFQADGATNLVITATQLGTAVDEFGAMTAANGANFTHTLANGINLPTAVAANTAVIIEWTATYELPAVAPGTFTSRAFSVAYAPNSQVIGSSIWVQHTVNGSGDLHGGWGHLANTLGSHVYMMGLTNPELAPLGATTGNNGNATWTLDPNANLANAVLNADPGNMSIGLGTLIPGAGYIGRGNAAQHVFSLSYAQRGQFWPHHGSGNNAHQRARPTGYVLTGNIAHAGFRNNEQVGSQAAINNLLNTYGATGRWATHTVERHIGSMIVDSSRFSNLGQVPGMRFNAIVGNASGGVDPNADNRQTVVTVMQHRLAGAAQGNVVRMGDYTHAFNAYNLPRGQVFASHGAQIPVTAGTTTTRVEFENAQMLMITTEENVGTSCAPIWERVENLPLGNRNFARFDFDLVGTDMSAVRAAALAERHPDEFYVNNNAGFNNRLSTITSWLGNPLLNTTDLASAPAADALEIGEGMRWELFTGVRFAVTVNNGTGGGNFEEGATVTVTADAPAANHHFVRWDGDYSVLADRNAAVATFDMPDHAVTLTAIFAEDERFALTVTGGTGGGNFFEGATGTVTADAPAANHHFVRWDGDYSILADRNAAETTFTMPGAAASVTAVFAEDERFALTVTGGTGGGNFFEGATGTVTANAPAANHHFVRWDGDYSILANRNAAETTFTMLGAAASVTAVFAEDDRFNFTVSGGTGTAGGPFFAGTQVSASAPATNVGGGAFERWAAVGVTLVDDTANPVTFDMPAANVTLTAVYADDPTYTLTVNNGTGSATDLPVGRFPIAANAPAAGMRFAAWTGDVAALDDATSPTTYVTITNANVTVTATFELIPLYAVTVVGGTGDGSFVEGAVVSITANSPPAGQMFNGWTGGVTFDDASATSTTFVMPANAVTVTANFVDIPRYELTVVGGTGSGSFVEGAVVTVTANAPQPGQVFVGWTGDVTFADANATSTTFVMPANAVAVTAVFQPVNRDALNALITAVEALQQNDYTADSWATLQGALSAARAVAIYSGSMQPQIDAVLEVLTLAKAGLVARPPANFDALNALIAQVEAMTQGNFTDASWAALQSELSAAQAITAGATQEEVDEALEDLAAAVSALRTEPTPPTHRYIFNTRWRSTFWNWTMFFLLFGFIWMWF